MARIGSASVRTVVSTAPPAGRGMTMVIGLAGQVSACAPVAAFKIATAAIKKRFIVAISGTLLSLDIGGFDDRPPLVRLSLLEGVQGVRRLPVAWRRAD